MDAIHAPGIQDALGDLVYVDLPEVGDTVEKGEEFAVVESVKSASDIYCPVLGEVVDINNELEDNPEKINVDPYGLGWIFIIKPDDEADLDELIDATEYADLIDE